MRGLNKCDTQSKMCSVPQCSYTLPSHRWRGRQAGVEGRTCLRPLSSPSHSHIAACRVANSLQIP